MRIDPNVERAAGLYLELLKKCLTRLIFPDRSLLSDLSGTRDHYAVERYEGRDWPTEAETMIGLCRLDNVQACIETALEDGVPGDLVETGAWRGGASILMRAVLKAYGVAGRRVVVADSFQGLPAPDPERYPQDRGATFHEFSAYLGAPLEQVKANFERYGLLDDSVVFLKGWFKDTLPRAPVQKIAVLRLDGDMYESTMDSLSNLYDRISDSGFVIVDDYGAIPNCRLAVDDFRRARGITEPLQRADFSGVFWRKGNLDAVSGRRFEKRPIDMRDFDEEAYLRSNPDVAEAVRKGSLPSGSQHFLLYGREEDRRLR